ncbi:MAG: hypothetical protein EG825_09930 [Rhodocyclaceae bacterium]|nr:hypothetical protein [Rhodocyclaceae bacterium]
MANFATEAAHLEAAILLKSRVLGIDWENASQVRALVKQTIASHGDTVTLDHSPISPEGMAKMELLRLTRLMARMLHDNPKRDALTFGGPAWKALAQALLEEAGAD